MARKAKIEPRTAAQVRSDTGRINALKGKAMRALKTLDGVPMLSKAGKAPGKSRGKPAGITMGE